MKTALTIAGSDCSAGAGIQADLKTFHAHGVYGFTAVTAVTAQNSVQVRSIQEVHPDMVAEQIRTLLEDFPIDAIKIGMLCKAAVIEAVVKILTQFPSPPVVLDPVLKAKDGTGLLRQDALETMTATLFPLADIVTPNLDEASELVGSRVLNLEDMHKAAQKISSMGPGKVVVKGGHLKDDPPTDVYFDGKDFTLFTGRHISTRNNHGTGCTFSAAIAANLANGQDCLESVRRAKEFIAGALQSSLDLGAGHGPVNHFFGFSYQL